jgi:tRNA A-37 threonylcarbamoyl transferase component Bud32
MARLAAGVAPRYRVERHIAEGGTGHVYLGYDTRLERRVAFKVLAPELATAVTSERFTREGRRLAQLHTVPNIVQAYDADETADGLLYFVMEFVDGTTLQRALEEGPLSLSRVRSIGSQLLVALEGAHEQGITHRDIKPGNIFLRGSQALLGDFGIASATDSDETTLTRPGHKIGTPLYMSPEQRLGLPADHRSDLYSLALVLRQCATGRPPNDARGNGKEAWRGVPASVREVVERALVEDPAKRWQSAAAFRQALEATSRRFSGWRRFGLIAAGAVALALAVGKGPAAVEALCRATHWSALCGARQRLRPADLAILPFTGQGGSDEGVRLSRLVGQNLEWFSVIKLMPMAAAAAWWDALPPSRKDKPPPGAQLYVEGGIARSAGMLEVSLDVRDSTGRLFESIRAKGDTGQSSRNPDFNAGLVRPKHRGWRLSGPYYW